jgi:anti-sigma factor RsiW
MSCSPFDLKDYFLQELTDPQQRQVEAHVKTCQACREELDRLGVTQAALCSLRDEEIPQRIAFVSDKIFEPSPWRRWLAGFWGSAARLGFASAAMLSAAIMVYALRPAPVQDLPKAPAQIVQTVSDADIQSRVDAAVARAAADLEVRQAEKNKQLVADLENARQRLQLAAAELDLSERRGLRDKMAMASYGPPHEDGGAR